MKTINYNYYHFGPFLYSTKITDDEVKTMLDICEKQKGKDFRKSLAGHLKEEYELPSNNVMQVLRPYFQSYCLALFETRKLTTNKLTMTSAWVNYMKAGEFNPPHLHFNPDGTDCALSCVLYLNIPDDMVSEKHVASSPPPGSISFMYGESLKNNIFSVNLLPEVGDFYIFPGWLQHCVYPFKSTGTRISVSANLKETSNRETPEANGNG